MGLEGKEDQLAVLFVITKSYKVGVRIFVIIQVSAGAQSGIFYLVAERLRGDEGNLLNDPLVGVKVQSELGVVFLDDDTSGLLHGFGSDATHDGQRIFWKKSTLKQAMGAIQIRSFSP